MLLEQIHSGEKQLLDIYNFIFFFFYLLDSFLDMGMSVLLCC